MLEVINYGVERHRASRRRLCVWSICRTSKPYILLAVAGTHCGGTEAH